MVKTLHAYIRTADKFDAGLLFKYYHAPILYGGLLDPKREPLYPTLSELEELLTARESSQSFYVVENAFGERIGFAILKGMNSEALFGEVVLLFEPCTYKNDVELPRTALIFMENRAFVQLHLRKLMITCVEYEFELKEFLRKQGYLCEGSLRESVYSLGKWHHLEIWSKLNPLQELQK